MCFDTKSSWIAWAVSVVIAGYLYRRNRGYDRWNALFLFTFTSIQLLEGFIWKSQKGTSVPTQLILLVLLLQPLAQSFGGLLPSSNVQEKYRNVLKIMCWVYGIILVWGIVRLARSRRGSFYSEVGKRGHLVWVDSESQNFLGGRSPAGGIISVLYLLGLFVPLLFQEKRRGWPLVLVGLATAVYSWIMTRGREFSSLWCFTSVIYGLVCLAL